MPLRDNNFSAFSDKCKNTQLVRFFFCLKVPKSIGCVSYKNKQLTADTVICLT